MTDGNTYVIDKYLDEREDWDALQEAEARIEELERAVRYEADVAQQALDSRKELKAKLSKSEALLAKAMKALDEAVYLLAPDEKDMARQEGVYRIVTTLAELEGETDE